MTLVEIGQIAKPIIFCTMTILSLFSLFILAHLERLD